MFISCISSSLSGGDPVSLVLLLYQQVSCCWFDQQGAVSLKLNSSICAARVSLSLWLVIICILFRTL